MWTNYHCHTNYCDGKKSIKEVVETSRSKKMLALGLSSHAPLPFERQWCMRSEMLGAYLKEISAIKSTSTDLEVYAGLEVDYIPGKISPHTFKDRLDYTVGSIHFVEWLPGGEGWEIDGTYKLFLDGLHGIFKGDIRKAVQRYYELTREMVTKFAPDIVGHMDKIKMHNRDDYFFNESDTWYREQIKLTLDAVATSGKIIEVNTRGIYQKKTETTYPSPWILAEIHKRNIPVTLSSDAHHPDDMVNLFPETAKELLKIGFKKIRILLDGRWTDVAFSENGITLDKDVTYHPMA